jgi:hypothetical protein
MSAVIAAVTLADIGAPKAAFWAVPVAAVNMRRVMNGLSFGGYVAKMGDL